MPTYQEQGEQEYHIHYYITTDIGTPDGEFLEGRIISILQTIILADDLNGATEYAEENKVGVSSMVGGGEVQVEVTLLVDYLDNLREAKDELEQRTSEATVEDDEEEVK